MQLWAEFFEPLIGENLIIQLDDGTPFPILLEKVSPMGQASKGEDGTERHRNFSLDLKGPIDPVLPSLTYPVSAKDMDPVPLFISAYHQDQDGTYYAISVN